MKTIGIIGGMGPLATVKLFENLTKFTKAKVDQEHLHVVIDSNPAIPDRNNAILYGGESPVDSIIESGIFLQERGAELLLIPCNNSHYYYYEIQSKLGATVLHMIELTAEFLARKKITKVGLAATIGTYRTEIFEAVFSNYDIEIEKPGGEAIKEIYTIISSIKSGETPSILSVKFDKIIANNFNSDVIIKGCTELSLINTDSFHLNYVDPLEILSMEAIKIAKMRI